ncbi:ABC transporter substrate-binding protein, partial [Paenibacillus sp. 28ISP30-2]|nr:ABC transporter substrate-binding protein [Paenibacillus sp. 28ISP30-2]
MKNKRKFTFASLFLSLAVLISACGNQQSGAGTDNQASGQLPKTNKVVIGVSGGDWEKNIRKAALD